MGSTAYLKYIEFNGAKFFTIILLPEKEGKFPTVILRSPYVQERTNDTEEQILDYYKTAYKGWTDNGYALVIQDCRGRGDSTGAFVPYIHEREDGLFLREWIREQDFYNGELFLMGASYTASLHYCTAPFEDDVKGAILEVQDCERYRLWYRNGQMRKGHANWHFDLYKPKCNLNKTHSIKSFSHLPLKDLSERVLDDRAEDFEQMLFAHNKNHEFWNTRFGGIEAKDAVKDTNVPVLLATSYNDYYTGGVFSMWNEMSEKTKQNCALLVSPYNHGDGFDEKNGIGFENARRREAFGEDYQIKWFNNIRNNEALPFKKGIISYYRTFEDRWGEDFYKGEIQEFKIPLGSGEKEIIYNPKTPPCFNPEGIYQNPPKECEDLITIYTEPFSEDVFVKGKMRASLNVLSDAEDTSFYIMISIKKPDGDYGLRHDITSLSYQLKDYEENTRVNLEFSFDEYAFLIKKGDVLRIDIAPTDDNTYVCHTNQKGEYGLQTEIKIARNKVFLDNSFIILPKEM